MSEKYKFDTMSLHSGHVPDKETGYTQAIMLQLMMKDIFILKEEKMI